MGFFKELIGGFVEGYINERGVDGTLDDLEDIAKGVKDFFNNSSSN